MILIKKQLVKSYILFFIAMNIWTELRAIIIIMKLYLKLFILLLKTLYLRQF
jgi:hypothetical protein